MSTPADLSQLRLQSAGPSSTVPMPPRRLLTRVAFPAAILLGFSALLGYAGRDALWPARAVSVVPVVVKAAGATQTRAAFQAAGWVEPDPFPIHVSALAAGVVRQVLVLEGQPVKANQVVVELVADDARLAQAVAQADVARREAERDAAAAELAAAESDWAHPIERKRAVDGAVARVAELAAEALQQQQQVAIEAAKVRLLAERKRRQEQARKANPDALTEFGLVTVKLQLEAGQATLAAAEAMLPVLSARLTRAKVDLAAAREQLKRRIPETQARVQGAARLKQAEAELARARTQLEVADLQLARMSIRSPVDGVVMERKVSPGSKLRLEADGAHSAHALHLYDPHKLQVRVDVPLADAAQVSVGQRAKIVVDVLPEHRFDGEVTRIVHSADIQKNTLQVKVRIEDPVPALKPEMLARVQFLATVERTPGERNLRVFAPERLVQRGEGKGEGQVWVVAADGRHARRLAVTLGEAAERSWIEVARGLQPGHRLIDGDPTSLIEGLRIRVSGESRASQ